MSLLCNYSKLLACVVDSGLFWRSIITITVKLPALTLGECTMGGAYDWMEFMTYELVAGWRHGQCKA